jgi:GNAT superfamily N-acetyltransferase
MSVSPSAPAAAVILNLHGLNRNLRHAASAETHEAAGFFRWRTPVPHAWYNGMISSEPPGPDASETVRATVEYFKGHGVAAFTWWLPPGLRADDWSPHLLPHGFAFDQRTPGMARDLADLPALEAPGLDIRRVEDRETLRAWAHTFTAGYELPESFVDPLFELYNGLCGPERPLRSYLAYRDSEPVATSSLFLGAGVAGIYDVATLPAARGQGIGSAATLAPLLEARDLGYRVGILQSSPKGLRVYERLGFRTVCAMEHFYWKADPNAPPPAV